ncbi:methyl-accepting chemotaxis protein [Bradyrhizobium lupini]|uniref:methyl-accepting chemotaxis protein n=1 Tax=Rhizobium lupini TaxID=136996 RepID=UPI00366B7D05
MATTIADVGRRVEEAAHMAREAVRKAELSDQRMVNLTAAAERIGSVVQLIAAIARQTNLLALNATIESARAGDRGGRRHRQPCRRPHERKLGNQTKDDIDKEPREERSCGRSQTSLCNRTRFHPVIGYVAPIEMELKAAQPCPLFRGKITQEVSFKSGQNGSIERAIASRLAAEAKLVGPGSTVPFASETSMRALKSLALNRPSVLPWSGRVKARQLAPRASFQAIPVSYRKGPLVLPPAQFEFSELRCVAQSVRALVGSAPCPILTRRILSNCGTIIERLKVHKQAHSSRARNRSPTVDLQGGGSMIYPRRRSMAQARSDLLNPAVAPQVGTRAPCVREVSSGAATEVAEPRKEVRSRHMRLAPQWRGTREGAGSRRIGNPSPASVAEEEGRGSTVRLRRTLKVQSRERIPEVQMSLTRPLGRSRARDISAFSDVAVHRSNQLQGPDAAEFLQRAATDFVARFVPQLRENVRSLWDYARTCNEVSKDAAGEAGRDACKAVAAQVSRLDKALMNRMGDPRALSLLAVSFGRHRRQPKCRDGIVSIAKYCSDGERAVQDVEIQSLALLATGFSKWPAEKECFQATTAIAREVCTRGRLSDYSWQHLASFVNCFSKWPGGEETGEPQKRSPVKSFSADCPALMSRSWQTW